MRAQRVGNGNRNQGGCTRAVSWNNYIQRFPQVTELVVTQPLHNVCEINLGKGIGQ